jgi:hypothetical protein
MAGVKGRSGCTPGKKKGGRAKGTPNKVTRELKDMVIQALANAGGVDYLTRQAEDNPGPFMTLLGKVLPLQVTGANGGPLVIQFPANEPTFDDL